MKTITITPSKTRVGFYGVVVPTTARQLLAVLRQTPGCGVFAGVWRIPCDRVAHISDEAKSMGFDVRGQPVEGPKLEISKWVNTKLYQYQIDAVARGLASRRLMLNFKPGLGKTPTAIEILKLARVSNALIIC